MRHWAFGRCQVYVALRCGRCGPVSPVPPPTTPSRTRCLHRRLARAARTCGLAAVAWPNRVNTGGDPSHGVNRLQWRAARGVALRTAGFAAAARRLPPTAHGRHALWTRCVRHEQNVSMSVQGEAGQPSGVLVFCTPSGARSAGAPERCLQHFSARRAVSGSPYAFPTSVARILRIAGALAARGLARKRTGNGHILSSVRCARRVALCAGPQCCVPVCPSADAGCCHARPDSRPP
jgi:hypothetical protein